MSESTPWYMARMKKPPHESGKKVLAQIPLVQIPLTVRSPFNAFSRINFKESIRVVMVKRYGERVNVVVEKIRKRRL